MNYTVQDLKNMIVEAQNAAYAAADAHEQEYYPNGGWGACGFAWVNIRR